MPQREDCSSNEIAMNSGSSALKLLESSRKINLTPFRFLFPTSIMQTTLPAVKVEWFIPGTPIVLSYSLGVVVGEPCPGGAFAGVHAFNSDSSSSHHDNLASGPCPLPVIPSLSFTLWWCVLETNTNSYKHFKLYSRIISFPRPPSIPFLF